MRHVVLALVVVGVACSEPEVPEYGPAYTELHRDQQRSVDRVDVKDRVVASLFTEPPAATGVPADVLRADLIDRLNVGFLLDGLGPGYRDRVTVSLGQPVTHGDVLGYDLTVDDPALPAPIEAVVLTAADRPVALDGSGDLGDGGAVARPAILGLHGHFQSVDEFRAFGYGQELAEQGYLVVILAFVEMECGSAESSLTEHLLNRGFSLIGLRAYQALALLELMGSWSSVDPARRGLIGHSGGSSTSWLVVRLSDAVRARVWDYEQYYNDLCGGRIHCETDPNLFVVANDILDLSTLATPSLQVPYEYLGASDRERIRSFFAEELAP